jgi:uncharacterized protein
MPLSFETELYGRIHAELEKVGMIDCHEHLERDRDMATGENAHIGRFFSHYSSSDLVSAGMSGADLQKIRTDVDLTPKERWAILEPWYKKSWNTAYNEALRIALRDIYGIEDFSADTVDDLTEKIRGKVGNGFTREIFTKSGIDFAMNNPFGPKPVLNPDHHFDCHICDMTDWFSNLGSLAPLQEDSGLPIRTLDEYLQVIDFYFERDAKCASAFKVGRAYDRPLTFEDEPKSAVEGTFNRMLRPGFRIDGKEVVALEDFIMHYLVRKCGDYDIRMKFHTGLQEGNGNIIMNSRAALLADVFRKYPRTKFDMYHISYPYQDELVTICKNFPNVTIDFCWFWIMDQAAGRRALSEMLDTVPANKIHGFGGDYIFVEGTYGHAVIAKREIARVLCEKVEEGRFSEDYAVEVGHMLLRDNALENFDLVNRRKLYEPRSGE